MIAVAILMIMPAMWQSHTCAAQERRQQPKQYQPASTQPQSSPAVPNVIVSPDEDYRIGPSDVIEIEVQDAPELSGTYRVNTAGTIPLPFLGKVSALQKTPEEFAALIADGLRGNYLLDPQVAVTVKQINSRSFFIQGAIRRPGIYHVEGQLSLLKLITVAGGLSDNYGSTAFIIREIKQPERDIKAADDPLKQRGDSAAPDQAPKIAETQALDSDPEESAKYELVKANINSLLRGNFDQNVEVKPGDIIHIPPADIFFVAGEVNAPGSFPLKEGTTLRQAISLAQGMSFNAATGRGVIFREEPASGKRQEIKVDIGAVMSGKKEDIQIMPNDIIIVPNSRMKSVTRTLLSAFGINAPRILYRY